MYDIVSEDGVAHIIWCIDDDATINRLQSLFAGVDYLYIADGHHRCASAVNVGQMRRQQNPDFNGDEEYNYFLAVIFPDEDLHIMDYNRVVKDLNGLTVPEFLDRVKEKFAVELHHSPEPYKPEQTHNFGMYLDDKWYRLRPLPGSYNENDPVASLDVSILQDNLLEPILGIKGPQG